MYFYESTPAGQGSYGSYATNATATAVRISYHFLFDSSTTGASLHTKIDRVLELLQTEPYEELTGTMSTQQAADYLAISKRTFERKVKAGLIIPIANDSRKNEFSKQAVLQFYMAYRGYKPTHLP
jgi:excisionase family DNA binding protein